MYAFGITQYLKAASHAVDEKEVDSLLDLTVHTYWWIDAPPQAASPADEDPEEEVPTPPVLMVSFSFVSCITQFTSTVWYAQKFTNGCESDQVHDRVRKRRDVNILV